MYCANRNWYGVSDLKNKVYVYSYTDPKTGATIYIGKGSMFRAWYHLNQSQNTRLHNLLQKRMREGYELAPKIEQLFQSKDEAKAFKLEMKLINDIGRNDLGKGSLFNNTDGGEGTKGVNSNPIEFRGIMYPNRTVLCEAFDMDESVVRRRLNLGWNLSEALNQVERQDSIKPRELIVRGQHYNSISQFAKANNLNADRVRHQLDNGFTGEQILNGEVTRKGTEVVLNGKVFVSVKSFAEHLGKSYKAVTYWLETGWSPKEIAENKITNRSAKLVYFQGNAMTMTKFAAYCNLSSTTVIKYRKQGLSLEDIFFAGQRPLAEKLNGKSIKYEGKTYNTLSQFNDEVMQMSLSTLSKWINDFEYSPKKCAELIFEARDIVANEKVTMKTALSRVSIKARKR